MTIADQFPLVTVGIPTFNRPDGLQRTLECIIAQTYKNLEIIVSDNCSTDPKVVSLLERFAAEDKRLQYYIQDKNLSIVPNFQFLLDKATGEYFMWAADDDNWDNNFIEICVRGMEANKNAALCMTDLKIVGMDGNSKPGKLDRGFMQDNLYSRNFHFVKSTDENKYFFCGLYRTRLVKNIPFNNNWGGDHMFIFEALSKGKFLYLPGQSNFYYYRGGNSTNMGRVRKAFNIRSRYYFFEAYFLKYCTYQFGFKHLNIFQKTGLFFSNALGLICNEDFILYYIFIKKPFKMLFGKFKRKAVESN
ncbi:MAG TPA: glycosyltransferase family A protein [Ferruginibacter sp.]|nr:glycosyltransferase family A protein [Ferruginibacter sp.]